MADPSPAGGAALDRLTAEIAGLRTDMQALVQGCTLLAEAQEASTEMVRQLLEATTREAPAENPMEALLAQVAEVLGQLTVQVQAQSRQLARLNGRLAGATIRGVGPAPAGDEDQDDDAGE